MIFSFLLGTAFIANGNILTAEHVLKPHQIEHTANHVYDLATIDADFPTGFNLECRKLKKGETVTIKGYPYNGYEQTYTEVETTVLGYNEWVDGRNSVELAVELAGGFSGSPVFDSDGDVVAIVTDSSRGEPLSLASSICNI